MTFYRNYQKAGILHNGVIGQKVNNVPITAHYVT